MPAEIAYAQWSWGLDSREGFVQSCKDLSATGYRYFESVSSFVDVFSHDPTEFLELCRTYRLMPCSFYFFLSGNFETDISELLNKIEFVAACGVKHISVQAKWGAGVATEEDLKQEASIIRAYGKICKPYGILPSVHPHHNTHIMYASDLAYIMQHTDPAEVGLAPDTAHLIACDCDPVAVFRQYIDRIRFMHLKDITGANPCGGMLAGEEVYANFRELGQGVVDFPAIFRILKEAAYDGYLCIELDGSRTSNRESAAMSFAYMKENWG